MIFTSKVVKEHHYEDVVGKVKELLEESYTPLSIREKCVFWMVGTLLSYIELDVKNDIPCYDPYNVDAHEEDHYWFRLAFDHEDTTESYKELEEFALTLFNLPWLPVIGLRFA